MSTIFYSLSLSLFDSLSTTQQIIIFVLLLTTAKPLRNALSYLAGLSGAYFVCGLAGYLALDELRVFLSKFSPSTAARSPAAPCRQTPAQAASSASKPWARSAAITPVSTSPAPAVAIPGLPSVHTAGGR